MASESEWSVGWMVVALAAVVAWFGWAFVAAGYAHTEEGWRTGGMAVQGDVSLTPYGRRRALGDFFSNAVVQIPNCIAVTKFAFTQRLWMVALFGCLEVAVLFVGRKMKSLEQELSSKSRRRKN